MSRVGRGALLAISSLLLAQCGRRDDLVDELRAETRDYFQAEPPGWATDDLWWRVAGWRAGDVGLVLHHANLSRDDALGVRDARAIIANVFSTGEVSMMSVTSWPWLESPYVSIDRRFEWYAAGHEPISPRRVLMHASRSAPWGTMRALLVDWPETSEAREFGVLGQDPHGTEVALVARLSAASSEPVEQRLSVASVSAPLPYTSDENRIRFEYGGEAWELPRGGYEVAQPRALAALNEFMASFSAIAHDRQAHSVEVVFTAGDNDLRTLHVVALLDVLRGAGARKIRVRPGYGSRAVDLDFLD